MVATQTGPESFRERWTRRSLSFGGYALAWLVLTFLLPLALIVTLALDTATDRRLPRTRALLFGWAYLACEWAGLLASLALWLASPLAGGERLVAWHYALQGAWAGTLLAAAMRLFSFRLHVTGDERVRPGPVLVFVRHASLADTPLSAVFLGRRHGMRLRWVMKRELLWDPCLDVVGQRLPNVFVRRGSGESAQEIAALARLAQGMGAGDGLVIYPEGTRFTAAKQAARLRAIEASGDAERLARATRLRHVLPPHYGGPLGLIDACPEADLLIVAHVGFEGIARFGDALGGALIGARVEVGCWRIAADAIPRDATARRRWLDAEWARVDDWIDERLADRGAHKAMAAASQARSGLPVGS